MNRTSDFKHEKLSCPLKTCWVSFRLVSESGESHAFGGLSFKLHTQYGETVNASLDEDGYCRFDSLYHGPLILEMAATATNIPDAWYEHLQLRDAFPLPISQLQVTAEQTPIGPRSPAGKTWLAEERALQEGAQFYRVEVSDFVSAAKHLRWRRLRVWFCGTSNTRVPMLESARKRNNVEIFAAQGSSPAQRSHL